MSLVDITPESCAGRSQIDVRSRVERLYPNGARCLIENCDPSFSVECCHVVPRFISRRDKIMDSLEWWWNLRRKSLDLDTSGNVFFAGASVHFLHDTNHWALLPSEDIIDLYHSTLQPGWIRFASRKDFPNIANDTYQYRFLPLQNMEHIAISRQTQISTPTHSSDFTVHVYPFSSMPTLECHIHPKFAIFELGRKLSLLPSDVLSDHVRDTPILRRVYDLFRAWEAPIPREAETDRVYNQPPDDHDHDSGKNGDGWRDDDKDPDYDDNKSGHTTPRRLVITAKRQPPSPSPRRPRNRRKTAGMTLKAIRRKLGADGSGQRVKEWLADAGSHDQTISEPSMPLIHTSHPPHRTSDSYITSLPEFTCVTNSTIPIHQSLHQLVNDDKCSRSDDFVSSPSDEQVAPDSGPVSPSSLRGHKRYMEAPEHISKKAHISSSEMPRDAARGNIPQNELRTKRMQDEHRQSQLC